MRKTETQLQSLTMVLYNDGLGPGNPFRHDDGRHVEAYYWALVEWADHILCRSFVWPVVTLIRAVVVNRIDGGLSYVSRVLLTYMMDALSSGLMVPLGGGESTIVSIKFGGLIADLVAHHSLTSWKGHGGTRCCLECSDLRRLGRLRAGEISLDTGDPTTFQMHKDTDILSIIDNLKVVAPDTGKTALRALASNLGLTYNERGLMGDAGMRSIYRPSTHHIRDYMHMLACDGVCN